MKLLLHKLLLDKDGGGGGSESDHQQRAPGEDPGSTTDGDKPILPDEDALIAILEKNPQGKLAKHFDSLAQRHSNRSIDNLKKELAKGTQQAAPQADSDYFDRVEKYMTDNKVTLTQAREAIWLKDQMNGKPKPNGKVDEVDDEPSGPLSTELAERTARKALKDAGVNNKDLVDSIVKSVADALPESEGAAEKLATRLAIEELSKPPVNDSSLEMDGTHSQAPENKGKTDLSKYTINQSDELYALAAKDIKKPARQKA